MLACVPYTVYVGPGQLANEAIPGGQIQNLSELSSMDPQNQKQVLGEKLYRNITPLLHTDLDLADKVIGMLLEMDISDIIHLLESQDDLHDKVQETMAVLQIQSSISLSELSSMDPQNQKQVLREKLYRNITPLLHTGLDLADKITGMLLEMDNSDIIHLLESQDDLHDKVQEAMAVLEAHKQKETNTSLSLAPMTETA